LIKSKVSIIKCSSYERTRLKDAIKKAVDLVGGMAGFVKNGQKVLVKPNLLSAKTPDDIVHTHPEIVRAVVQLAKEAGGVVSIGDSPSAFFTIKNVDTIYENSGLKSVACEEGVPLVRFDKLKRVKGYPVAEFAKESDVIISVPKFKTHDLTVITGAVKNMFGLIPGLYKVECHKKSPNLKDFAKILIDVFSIVKPQLTIMDAVIGMEGDGPGSAGLARNVGLIMASSDAVSVDTVFSHIIGFEPSRNLVIKEAKKRGEGIGDLENIVILGEKLEDMKMPDYKLPEASMIYLMPSVISRPLSKLLSFKPFIEEDLCKKCEICVKSCPVDAITINKEISLIDPKVCVKCFCCHEVCPYKAISIKKNIFARILWSQ